VARRVVERAARRAVRRVARTTTNTSTRVRTMSELRHRRTAEWSCHKTIKNCSRAHNLRDTDELTTKLTPQHIE
jgi:hypothetical protein